jgi:hypothetical protein
MEFLRRSRGNAALPTVFCASAATGWIVNAKAVSRQWPRTIAGYPGAERRWTPAPADHVAVSVIDRHAEPRAVGSWQWFSVGVIHIARRRIGGPVNGADRAADTSRVRRG